MPRLVQDRVTKCQHTVEHLTHQAIVGNAGQGRGHGAAGVAQRDGVVHGIANLAQRITGLVDRDAELEKVDRIRCACLYDVWIVGERAIQGHGINQRIGITGLHRVGTIENGVTQW